MMHTLTILENKNIENLKSVCVCLKKTGEFSNETNS